MRRSVDSPHPPLGSLPPDRAHRWKRWAGEGLDNGPRCDAARLRAPAGIAVGVGGWHIGIAVGVGRLGQLFRA